MTLVAETGELVPASGQLVTGAPVAQVAEAMRYYRDLCTNILDESDYQGIGGKQFPKKSAWRKLAVAFNVSVTLTERRYSRLDNGAITRAEVLVRATAPNGRAMDGLGICSIYERCCSPRCFKAHHHCDHAPELAGAVHFSAAEHDIPATAMTRATNRACSDLFGMGEVSAEEIGTTYEAVEYAAPVPDIDPMISSGQRKAMHAAFRGLGIDRPERLRMVARFIGRSITSANDLTYDEASRVLNELARVAATPDDTPAPSIFPATEDDLEAMRQLYDRADFQDEELRVRYASNLLGRELATVADVTHGEAAAVIAGLRTVNGEDEPFEESGPA